MNVDFTAASVSAHRSIAAQTNSVPFADDSAIAHLANHLDPQLERQVFPFWIP